MEFVNVMGFDVLPGKSLEFQAWVRANSGALTKAMPEGTELIGIYASVFSSEKDSGGYRVLWRMDSYAAMDRFTAAMGQDPELARLMNELGDFGDVRLGAGNSNELLKSMADVTIWGDHAEE